MRTGEIIVFTSGAGQYYHIEAVVRVVRDFTDQERKGFETAYNSPLTQAQIQNDIKSFVELGLIEPVQSTEFNAQCHQAGAKVKIRALQAKRHDAFYADTLTDFARTVDTTVEALLKKGEPGFTPRSHALPTHQRLCGVDVDHVNKAVTLLFVNGPEIKIEGVDFLRDDNIQALRNLIAIVCPEQM